MLYKCFPPFNSLCNRVLIDLWWRTYPVRGVCLWKAALLFDRLYLARFTSNSNQTCSNLLALVFLVIWAWVSCVRTIARAAGYAQSPRCGVSLGPHCVVSHTPCAGYGVCWSVVLLCGARLGHFRLQVGLVQSRLHWLNVFRVLFGFKSS